jgi:biotin transport system permease protein
VALAVLAGVLAVGLGVARLPVRLLARQARAVLWWLVALFAVHALVTDVLTGAVTVTRLLGLVLAAAVVTATTRVTAMVAVVERVCAPLRWVGVRPARIGLVLAMALRFIPLVAERADRIREAQAARGGSVRGLRGLTTTVVPLLVQVLQLAHTVSEALDARGADDVPPARRRRAALPEAS